MEPLLVETVESLTSIAELLIGFNYKLVQYIPMGRIHNRPGREFHILHSFLFKDKSTLFKGSAIQPLYEKYLNKKQPDLYKLYCLFFRGEKLSVEIFLK